MTYYQHNVGQACRLLLPLLCLLCAACGGGSGNSSSDPGPPPPPAAENVLAFQADTWRTVPKTLNILDRQGRTVQVSEDTGGLSVGWSISPDAKTAAYYYVVDEGHLVLVLQALDALSSAPTRVEIEGRLTGSSQWLQWLPDSRGVLYSVAMAGHPLSLWLASPGDEQPVKLFEPEPGPEPESVITASLSYTASHDGSRVAVVVNYSETLQGSSHAVAAALYIVETSAAAAPRLIDSVVIEETNLYAAWSPTDNTLVYYQGDMDSLKEGASGPLHLLREDGSSPILRDDLTVKGVQWIASSRILVPVAAGFEVIDTDGNQLAAHVSDFSGTGGDTGAASITVSPDKRWLAFLDWSSETLLEVYVLDLDRAETRVVGPASSVEATPPRPIPLYYESELYWSADSTWLAWDRQTVADSQDYVYAVEVETGRTHPISPGAKFDRRTDSPWLPRGNVLEYRLRVTAGDPPYYALMVDDLDSGRTLYAQPYPMPGITVTDPGSGQPFTATPETVCHHTWLTNEALLWEGCDFNVYLSRVVDGTQTDTELIAPSALLGAPTGVSKNREIVLMTSYSPSGPGHWLMYDYPAGRLIELEASGIDIALGNATFLM